jgi:ATP-dependent helicase HrpA
VEEHLTQPEKLALAHLPHPSFSAFIDDVISGSIDRELERIMPNRMIFEKSQYEAARAAIQSSLMDVTFDTAGLVAKIMVAAREATKAISEVKAFEFLSILAAEKQHVEQLVGPGFVLGTGLDRLPRVLVYLQAIKHRIEKLTDNPLRDRTAATELDQALGIYLGAGGTLPLAANSDSKIVRARWLIEELRVSLFAQHLGTSEPVSVQRIKKALADKLREWPICTTELTRNTGESIANQAQTCR